MRQPFDFLPFRPKRATCNDIFQMSMDVLRSSTAEEKLGHHTISSKCIYHYQNMSYKSSNQCIYWCISGKYQASELSKFFL